jgi:putative PIN family toxin of toxin-antitoxin system
MEIMVDSNVIVSAVLFPNAVVARVFNFILDNHKLVLCNYIINEVENVFQEKFPHKMNELKEFIGSLKYRQFDLEKVNISIYPKIRDIDDIPVLIAAIESNVDMLITGDKDFDEIAIEKPIIIKPRKFLDEYMN